MSAKAPGPDQPSGPSQQRQVHTLEALSPPPPRESVFGPVIEILQVLGRRKGLFGLTFVLLFGGLAVSIVLKQPVYESTALLLVKIGRELVYRPEVGSGTVSQRNKETVINSQLAMVRSQDVVTAAVGELGIATLYPEMVEPGAAEKTGVLDWLKSFLPKGEDPSGENAETPAQISPLAGAAERFRNTLSVSALPSADVIKISFQHLDPNIAAQAVNVLVEHFTDKHVAAFSQGDVLSFLEARVGTYKDRLTAAEQAIQQFEAENSAFSLSEPHTLLVSQRDDTQSSLERATQRIAEIRARTVQDDPVISKAQQELLDLRLQRSRLTGELRESIDERIAIVEDFVLGRTGEVNSHLHSLESERSALQARIWRLDSTIATLPELSRTYRGLVRERSAMEAQYKDYLLKLQEARLSNEMDQERIASISVIQSAYPSPVPASPRSKGFNIAVALIVSLAAAALVASLWDALSAAWAQSRTAANA